MFKHRYRIVTDSYAGFEAQVKVWWFPFVWFQVDGANTHLTVDKAESFILNRVRRVVKEVRV